MKISPPKQNKGYINNPYITPNTNIPSNLLLGTYPQLHLFVNVITIFRIFCCKGNKNTDG